jgi:protocatechuate 3,4-dioxygenase beta subunit
MMIGGTVRKSLILSLITLLLTSCGGGTTTVAGGTGTGTGTGGTDTGSGDGGSGTAATLTLSLIDPISDEATLEVNGNDTVEVRAQVAGTEIEGVLVTFSSTIGQLDPISGTALTDATGLATIDLTAGSVEGAGTVRATADVDGLGVEDQATIASDGQGSTVGSSGFNVAMALDTPDGSLNVSRANQGTAILMVTDNDGVGISNAVVSFTLSGSGSLTGTTTVFSSDGTGALALGAAEVTVLPGTTAGQGTLAAQVSMGSETVNADSVIFISAGDGFSTLDLSIPFTVPANENTTDVDNDNPVTVTATVIDQENNPVPGAIVSFSLSSADGAGVLSRASHITNASGIATTDLLAGTVAGLGQVRATTTVAGASVSSLETDVISFNSTGDGPFDGQGSSNLNVALVLDTDDVPATSEDSIDADNPGRLIATVTDAQNNLLDNIIVEFATDRGDLLPANGQVLTSNGVAEASLTAGSVPGAGIASATVLINNQRFNADSLTFSTLGNAGDTVIVLTLAFEDQTPGNESNIITPANSATIEVRAEDDGGTDLPFRTATLQTTLGELTVDGVTDTIVTATTDEGGRVNAVLSAASGDVLQSGSVTVTIGDTRESVNFDVGVDGLRLAVCAGGTGPTDCTSGGSSISDDTAPDNLDVNDAQISAQGSTTIQLVVLDDSVPPNVIPDIDIEFTSICAESIDPDTGDTLATLTETSKSNANGIVSATYKAKKGCEGNDTTQKS